MKESYIRLIHKKGEKRELKNWRPISLTNTDYKIQRHAMKQVRGPGHNVSCGAPALVLHENMRNTCLNCLQVRPR